MNRTTRLKRNARTRLGLKVGEELSLKAVVKRYQTSGEIKTIFKIK